METIKQNSFWIVEGDGDNAVMSALCESCGLKLKKGWFWEGCKLGYGNYDLFCKNCKNAIYIRPSENQDNKIGENANKTNTKSQE